jgi:hypothetical protein
VRFHPDVLDQADDVAELSGAEFSDVVRVALERLLQCRNPAQIVGLAVGRRGEAK